MNTDVGTVAARLGGKFIVLDGPDGAGKSTQRRLLAEKLEASGVSVVSCRDPGGTQIGDRIRKLLLDYDLSTMDVRCETLLFMASRAQLVAEVIQPALQARKTVLCDRFITSTCCYQGAVGFDPARVIELARMAIGETWPDVTFVLDVSPEEGFSRIGRKPHHAGKNRKRSGGEATLFDDVTPDAMEARSIDFHRRVRRLFQEVHAYYPTPVITVDGGRSDKEVHQRVWEELLRVAH